MCLPQTAKVASDDGLNNIKKEQPKVATAMTSAAAMFKNEQNNCNLAAKISDEGWTNVLAEVGRQRMLGQQVISQFFLAARGVNVADKKSDTSTALTAGSSSMRTCIEGSYFLEIPSPPSQQIVNALLDAQQHWLKFQNSIEKNLLQANLADSDLTKAAFFGDSCKSQMDHVAALYVNASLAIKNSNIVLVEISWRQLIVLQQMTKQA